MFTANALRFSMSTIPEIPEVQEMQELVDSFGQDLKNLDLAIEQIVRETGGKPLKRLDPVFRAIIHIRHALEMDRALMRKTITSGHVDREKEEIESLEEKRKKVVDFCESAFKPKYVDEMKRKFASTVAEWDEETLSEWIRRGIDESVAERIFLEIQGTMAGDEEDKWAKQILLEVDSLGQGSFPAGRRLG
jgi:hypothetical protein